MLSDVMQVEVIRTYTAKQPDELSLQVADVVLVSQTVDDGTFKLSVPLLPLSSPSCSPASLTFFFFSIPLDSNLPVLTASIHHALLQALLWQYLVPHIMDFF